MAKNTARQVGRRSWQVEDWRAVTVHKKVTEGEDGNQ